MDTARAGVIKVLVDSINSETRRKIVKEFVLDNVNHLLLRGMFERFVPPPNQLLAVVEGDGVVGCTAGYERRLGGTTDTAELNNIYRVNAIAPGEQDDLTQYQHQSQEMVDQ